MSSPTPSDPNRLIGTDPRQALLRSLSQERSLLLTLMDHLPDLIYVKDTESRFILANRATAEVIGVPPEALTGHTDHEFFEKRLADAFRADEVAVMTSGQPLLEREEPTNLYQGKERWILTTKVPLFDANRQVVGVLGIGRDITARRAAERALRQANAELEARVRERTIALANINDELRADIASRQELQQRLEAASAAADAANRAKDLFLANMSHEMRTPLNGILGMSELLLGTRLEREQHHFAEIIRDSGEALLTLVEDLLDLSKVEAGKLDIISSTFDLHRLADEVVAVSTLTADAKGLAVSLRWQPGTPQHVQGDPGRVRQVMANLMNNGIKFTERGSVVMTISAAHDHHIDIAVIDTGPGLDAELQERLFQPFVQGEVGARRRYGGAGLGLALSRRICELMGGSLRVDSTPGHGATFTASIPLPTATSDAPAHAATDEVRKQGTGRRERHSTPYTFTRRWWLLLVEDNPLHRQVTMELLEGLGLKIDVAANGQEAVELATHSAFDGILMDCHMPVMDGFAATQMIRASSGPCRSIPIIALTADALPADRERCLAAGMDDHLAKPIGRTSLVETLARHLHAEVIAGVPMLPDQQVPAGHVSPTRPRVLVVDDNFANRQVAAAMCRRLGCQVVEAEGGELALRVIAAGGIDVVLLDVNMPDLDGPEVCRRQRVREQSLATHLPIIGCTAGLHHAARAACLAAGMDAVTNKPLSMAELGEALRTFVTLPDQTTTPTQESAPRRPVIGALPDADILDWTVIAQHLELNGGQALVKRLIAHFRADAPIQRQRLEERIAANDRKQTEAVAHRLLGSARAVGLVRLSTACHTLERCARSGETWPPYEHFAAISAAIQEANLTLSSIEPRLEAIR